jgi:hypothetical protein
MKYGEEIKMSGNNEPMSLDVNDEATKSEEPTVDVVVEPDPAVSRAGGGEDDDVQSQLKQLQQNLETERRARKEAEVRARDATQHANKAYSEVEDTNFQLVVNAIDTVRRENDILRSHYKEAMSVGDYDRVAEIQESMGSNSAKLLQLENGKAAMEARPRQQQVPTYADPVEDFASRLSNRSAEWIRRNPQFVTDTRLQQKMIAAHNLAVADGYRPDSDEYFEYVEDTLKTRRQPQQETAVNTDSPMSSASKPAPRAAPPAAPVNRSSSQRGNTVRLSSAEAETAKMFGMTDQEYAKHKLALQREGKMN